uniref:Uncharacterized protein n=1 Tax=Opuntia streptacantha TaxID=393608 RepID=A0A7C8YUI7_OPUST
MSQEVPTPVPQMMEELVVMKDILVGRAQHSYWLQEGPTEKTLLMALTITLVAGTLLTAITGLLLHSVLFLSSSLLQSGSLSSGCAYLSFVSVTSVFEGSLWATPA